MKTPDKKHRKYIAQETMEMLRVGMLGDLDISESIKASVEGTCSYSEKDMLPKLLPLSSGCTTQVEVANMTTIQAARELLQQEPSVPVAVLNFASAKNPGGGFLNGALAQEESLALNSALYACLENDPMYDYHRSLKGGIYSDWCIYSPQVPVIRNEEEWDRHFLENPWYFNVLTCPCLNQGTAKLKNPDLEKRLEKRMRRMLSVLAGHHPGNVVLGAWGCGVFKNDPRMIASLFAKMIMQDRRFINRWPRVIFAVLDEQPTHKTIRAFESVFRGTAVSDSAGRGHACGQTRIENR